MFRQLLELPLQLAIRYLNKDLLYNPLGTPNSRQKLLQRWNLLPPTTLLASALIRVQLFPSRQTWVVNVRVAKVAMVFPRLTRPGCTWGSPLTVQPKLLSTQPHMVLMAEW